MVLGFEPTTPRPRVSSFNHQTRTSAQSAYTLYWRGWVQYINLICCENRLVDGCVSVCVVLIIGIYVIHNLLNVDQVYTEQTKIKKPDCEWHIVKKVLLNTRPSAHSITTPLRKVYYQVQTLNDAISLLKNSFLCDKIVTILISQQINKYIWGSV